MNLAEALNEVEFRISDEIEDWHHYEVDKVLAEHARKTIITDEMVERAAKVGHETYELAAPEFGYATRTKTRVPWEELPESNRLLMLRAYRAALEAAHDDR